MKKLSKIAVLTLLGLVILFAVAATCKAAVSDPVIKVVGDRVSIVYNGDPSKLYVVKITNSKGVFQPTPVLTANGKEQTFPMFSGNGTYEVGVYYQTPKGTFSPVIKQEVEITEAKSSDQFLNSGVYVDFGVASSTTGQANKLASGAKGDADRANAIWDFIRNNYKYDYDKLSKGLPSGYFPDLDEIFKIKKGVCMDTAAELAGMLRSIGIPTRFVMGTTSVLQGAHAWVEVQIDKKWVLVDISVDIQKVEFGMANELGDDPKDYKAEKIY